MFFKRRKSNRWALHHTKVTNPPFYMIVKFYIRSLIYMRDFRQGMFFSNLTWICERLIYLHSVTWSKLLFEVRFQSHLNRNRMELIIVVLSFTLQALSVHLRDRRDHTPFTLSSCHLGCKIAAFILWSGWQINCLDSL